MHSQGDGIVKMTTSFQSRLLRLRYTLFCIGKAFRTRKTTKTTPDRSESKNTFTVINDEGQEVVCNVLLTFDNDEDKHYIVYTDNTKDQEGNVQVYASMYDPQQEDQMELQPIETPEEWAVIEDILTSIQEEIKNGEHVDSEDEDEDDDILEPLPFAVWKKVSDWTDRLHFPVGALLPYIIGVVIFCLIRTNQLPVWVDISFVVIELLLMRISYDDIENMHSAVSGAIIMYLYMDNLLFLLDPLVARLFPNMGRITFEPWGFRGAVIVISIVLILKDKLKKWKRHKAWRREIG